MPRLPEILAPAGDEDALAAALGAGADAVYFGLDEGMNARARATNFSVTTLAATCDRIHRAGARAYVTMNTLVFEEELQVAESLIRACAKAGVNALIVQDPAVALIARAVAPTLEVHASTQMTISSPEAAKFAGQLGCTRIVVPRELSVNEIRKFVEGTPIEVEVFVHGAQCVSWSGQCLTSEAWGGRSANRGQCAQSCRMPYDLVVDDVVREDADVKYLLSPLDLAAVRAVPALAAIGVASLKIEGRLKGPAYVATAVRGYRRWLDAIGRGAEHSTAATTQLKADLADMTVAYSRGFSDGFLGGSDHQDLVEGRFPKHRGRLVGVVVEVTARGVHVARAAREPSGGLATREGYAPTGEVTSPLPAFAGAHPDDSRGIPLADPDIAPGVGIGFDAGDPQQKEQGGPLFRVEPAPDGWWLAFGRPGPELTQVNPGDRVWITSDSRLDRDAERLVAAGEPEGRIPVTLTVRGAPGQPLTATLTARGHVGRDVSVEGSTTLSLGTADHGGLDADVLRDKLGALGGTPFRLTTLDTSALPAGLHLPVSALKPLRRDLTTRLLAAVLANTRHAVTPGPSAPVVVAEAKALHARRPWSQPDAPHVLALCRTAEQLEAVIDAGLPEVELDWMELVGLEKAVNRAREAGLGVAIATVRIQKPGEEAYDRRIDRLRPDAVLVRHWGGLVHFSGLPDDTRPIVHGDFSLNVTNAVTAHHLLALGADTLTASHDLDEAQLHALLANFPAERMTVVAHHHIATFHTEHCVYAHTLSHGRDFRSCGRPCEAHKVALRDHEGLAHPIVVDVGCRNTVFNAKAQTAASAVPKLVARGVRRFRLEFVWETRDQTRTVIDAYRGLLSGHVTPADVARRVAAHEQFGVTSGTLRTLKPVAEVS